MKPALKETTYMLLRCLFIANLLFMAGCSQYSLPLSHNPAIDMQFTFKPSFSALSAGDPKVWLDVCADKKCISVDSSILLSCHLQNAIDHDFIYVTDCSEHAAKLDSETSSEFSLFDHYVYLRLKVDHLKSRPFAFDGQKARKEALSYSYTAEWTENSLQVEPR